MISKCTLKKKKSLFSYRKLRLLVTGFFCLEALCLNQVHAQVQLVITGNSIITLGGGTSTNPVILSVHNSSENAVIYYGNGQIRSEGQFNIFRWNIKNSTGTYIVPLGDTDGTPLPVELNITSAGTSDGFIDFSTYATGQNNLPLPQGVSSIAHADTSIPEDGAKLYDRYWFIDANSYATKPSGTISFSYNPAYQTGDLISGTTAMQAQFHNGINWVINQFGLDDLSGSVSGVPFSDDSFFSTFTLVESVAALPITLLSFNAVWNNDEQSEARVFWSTASELNNEFFDIERSRDGYNWHKINQVAGAGTSIHAINYQILDKNPLNGISYYRLKQTDYDGAYSYSNVVSLNREITRPAISLYPNPATNNFKIYFDGFKSDVVNVSILDNSGRIVLEVNPNVTNNPEQQIETANFQSGVYYIHVRSENEVFTEKIVIKN
jgi:hypothetical protein